MTTKTKVEGKVAGPAPAKPVLSKREAVRQALAKLGRDAGPSRIRDYIRERLGVVMTADHVSANKSQLLAEEARRPTAPATRPVVSKSSNAKPAQSKPPAASPSFAGKEVAARKVNAPAAARGIAPAETAGRGNGTSDRGIDLKDILAVRELVGRVGAEQLQGLIDVFGR